MSKITLAHFLPKDKRETNRGRRSELKEHLVMLGLKALAEGDDACVALITEILRERGVKHA